MSATLETLFANMAESAEADRAYEAARAVKVAAIAENIRDQLRYPHSADIIAEGIMSRAEEAGRIDGNDVMGEVSPDHVRGHRPIAVCA